MSLPHWPPSPALVQELVKIRHHAFKAIRAFFDDQDYMEIDAPSLIQANAVETFIDPLQTEIHSPDDVKYDHFFLMTSPEVHMKRLLCRGLHKIYFLGHVFRDRERSSIHRNEFMMLEWYEARVDLSHLFDQCEALFQTLFKTIRKFAPSPTSSVIQSRIEAPFERLSVASAWDQYAQIDLLHCLHEIAKGNEHALVEAVVASGESLRPNADFDDAFTHIMVKKIEPMIGRTQPCILFDWPAQTAALAKLNPHNHLLAHRFEIYFSGMEIANAFEELNDPYEQRERFVQANLVRRSIGRPVLPIPESFILELQNMPPSCGIAVGIDRLIAVLLGRSDLEQIIPSLP